MCQELTEVLPHQIIKVVCGAVTGLAARLGWRIKPPGRPPAPIVTISTIGCQTRTGGLTLSAAYQCPQQIGIDRIVTRGALLVEAQLGLDSVELLLAYQGWNCGHPCPFLSRGRVSSRSRFADGMGGRASHTSWAQSLSANVDVARISGI